MTDDIDVLEQDRKCCQPHARIGIENTQVSHETEEGGISATEESSWALAEDVSQNDDQDFIGKSEKAAQILGDCAGQQREERGEL